MSYFLSRGHRISSQKPSLRNRARLGVERLEDRSLLSTGLLLGSATTSLSTKDDVAEGVALQSDGKILAAGYSNAPGSNGWPSGNTSYFAVVRYNSDLTLDTSFGTGGLQTTAMTSGRANQAQAVALQSDGKSFLAGWTSSGSKNTANDDFAVARYTTSGSLDTSFGNGKGYVITDVAGKLKNNTPLSDSGEAVAIDGGGKIVVAGWASNGTYKGFALARYTSTGALDTGFNSGGSLPGTITSFPQANVDDQATSIVIQSDGKIVVGGYGNNKFVLERYNSNGTLDAAFGTAGVVVAPVLGNGGDVLNGIALDASGNIVAVGHGSNPGDQFLVARFTPGGSLDATFNGNGYEFTDVFPGIGASAANAVTIESNGDIAAAGGGDGPSTATQLVIVEYMPNGALDTTFNGTGIFTQLFAGGPSGRDTPANAVRINSAGNFVVAGLSGNNASSQNPDFLVAVVDPPSATSSGATPAMAPAGDSLRASNALAMLFMPGRGMEGSNKGMTADQHSSSSNNPDVMLPSTALAQQNRSLTALFQESGSSASSDAGDDFVTEWTDDLFDQG